MRCGAHKALTILRSPPSPRRAYRAAARRPRPRPRRRHGPLPRLLVVVAVVVRLVRLLQLLRAAGCRPVLAVNAAHSQTRQRVVIHCPHSRARGPCRRPAAGGGCCRRPRAGRLGLLRRCRPLLPQQPLLVHLQCRVACVGTGAQSRALQLENPSRANSGAHGLGKGGPRKRGAAMQTTPCRPAQPARSCAAAPAALPLPRTAQRSAARRGAPVTCPTSLAGEPATMVPGGTGFSTSDPAATCVPGEGRHRGSSTHSPEPTVQQAPSAGRQASAPEAPMPSPLLCR